MRVVFQGSILAVYDKSGTQEAAIWTNKKIAICIRIYVINLVTTKLIITLISFPYIIKNIANVHNSTPFETN